jgi:predicted DNA-binding transcriptional regulator AlpA
MRAIVTQSNRAVADLQQTLHTPESLSAFLGVPVATLYRWRTTGDGPPALKIGRHLRYRPRDVERWLDQKALEASR